MELWRDWIMMNRLHCTYTELHDEPYAEMLVFAEFAAGEAAAEKEISDNRK